MQLAVTYKKSRPTDVTAHMTNLEPIVNVQFRYPALLPASFSDTHFQPEYIISNSRIIEKTSKQALEIEAVKTLIDIGSILFKDSRRISPEESSVMHSYFKKKYKKIKKAR